MKPFRKMIVVLLLTLAIAPAVLAGGFQINEHGARAMGMAGAFAAQASDASAIFFNPAGIAFQDRNSILVGSTWISPSTSFTGPSPSTVQTSMVSQNFFPVNFYGTYMMENGLSFGLGFYSPYGLGTEWPADWAGCRLAVKTDLRTFFINPTVAYKLNEQFSFGVGASYVISDVKLKYRVPTYSSLAPPTPATKEGTAALEANKNSVNFNLGILYRPNSDLSIGVSYRHSTKINYKGTATFTDMQALQSFFPGGDGSTSITLPNNVFAGIAYHFSKVFTMEADFQYVGWSSYDALKVEIAPGPAAPAALGGQPLQKSPPVAVKDWKNAYIVRLGGEYRLNEFAFRAGFIYDKTPQPDKTVEPLLPDANRAEFTLGLGYKFTEYIGVNAAYQFILFSDRTVTAATNIFPGTYESTANLFGLNVEYGL